MPQSFKELMDLKLPLGTDLTLSALLAALVTLLLCLLATRFLLKLSRRVLEKTKLDERVQKYALAGLKFLLYVLTGLIVIDGLGIKVSSLVALLSVASLGVTLAAEDILGNVAGGLVLLSSHPFSIGDFIEVGGTSGTVEEIGLNHTKLVTPDGQRVMLPNRELASSKLINYTVLGKRRIARKVTASYEAPAATVKAACLKAVGQLPKVLSDPAPVVYVTDYGASSIEYTIYCWTAPGDYWPTLMALNEGLREAFEEAQVEMTYDHLNVHLVEDRTK